MIRALILACVLTTTAAEAQMLVPGAAVYPSPGIQTGGLSQPVFIPGHCVIATPCPFGNCIMMTPVSCPNPPVAVQLPAPTPPPVVSTPIAPTTEPKVAEPKEIVVRVEVVPVAPEPRSPAPKTAPSTQKKPGVECKCK